MAKKFRNKYRIDSARWQNWDYGWDGAYFLTICTKNRRHYFGAVVDGKMQLSHAGIIADVFWNEIKNHAENIHLGAYQIMPNHVHGILILDGNKKQWEPDRKENTANESDSSPVQKGNTSSQNQQPGKTPGQSRFQNQGKNTILSIAISAWSIF